MTAIFETFAEGVHAVVIQDDLAILDVRADAYLCLAAAAQDVVATERGLLIQHGSVADQLRDAGLLGVRRLSAQPAVRLPSTTAIHEPTSEPLRPMDFLHGYGVCSDLRNARASTGLEGFLALVSTRDAASDPSAVIAAARRFRRLSPWLPIEGECLVRSAMLVSYLRRSGLSADWVFAVRLWPFSAHCWVQCGDVCLNDDVERLTAYTPILVT